MRCTVCTTNPHKYRCPQCSSGYCSVGCFKIHKDTCTGLKREGAAKKEGASSGAIADTRSEFDKWLVDPDLQQLIKDTSVQHHLRVVADIMQDARLSGENTTEGRRMVAVKKLRELRMGGREQNEAIEHFSRLVLEHIEKDKCSEAAGHSAESDDRQVK